MHSLWLVYYMYKHSLFSVYHYCNSMWSSFIITYTVYTIQELLPVALGIVSFKVSECV